MGHGPHPGSRAETGTPRRTWGARWVPMFPELRPLLEAAFEQAEPGTEFVVSRSRDSGRTSGHNAADHFGGGW